MSFNCDLSGYRLTALCNPLATARYDALQVTREIVVALVSPLSLSGPQQRPAPSGGNKIDFFKRDRMLPSEPVHDL
jgi:hypothetical protein